MKDRPSGWIDKERLIPTALYFRQIPPSEVKHVRYWLSTPSLREKLVFAYGDKNIAKLDAIVESIIAKDKQVIKWHIDELEKAIGSKFVGINSEVLEQSLKSLTNTIDIFKNLTSLCFTGTDRESETLRAMYKDFVLRAHDIISQEKKSMGE